MWNSEPMDELAIIASTFSEEQIWSRLSPETQAKVLALRQGKLNDGTAISNDEVGHVDV
jgi:hypothetical protein